MRPPSQNDDTNELFFKELRETSRSTALVLMGDFNPLKGTCQMLIGNITQLT